MAHLNVRSLRNKDDELECLQLLCKFNIIAITESHLDNSISDSEISIDGMKILRLDRTGRKGGGYVLYYADHLKALQRKDYLYSQKSLWLHVRFPATSVLFAVMYRPPDDNNFFNVVNTILEKAWLKSSNIFLLGDLNCNYSDCRNTNRAKLQCIINSVNMHNVITNPTRITMESSTLIDLIVTT